MAMTKYRDMQSAINAMAEKYGKCYTVAIDNYKLQEMLDKGFVEVERIQTEGYQVRTYAVLKKQKKN